MPHWAEGLTAAYAVAALVVGVVFAFGTDLPWAVKFWCAVLWPLAFGAMVWSMWTARTEA